MKNQSIFIKIFFVFFIIIFLSIASHLLVAQNVQKEFFKRQAQSISRQIILTRQWIAGLGGVWSKDGYSDSHGFLTEYKESDGMSQATFYLHNPALATREIASLADIKFGYTFRVVSDFNREPSNEADFFEAYSIKKIKQKQLKYTETFEDNMYRYTEPLFVKKGCLRCHGDLETEVLEPMKSILLNKYGNKAFGYKEGDVRGIISIQIPKVSWTTTLSSVFNYWNYMLLAIAIVIFYLFTMLVIVKPVKKLTEAAIQLSTGKLTLDLGTDKIKDTSKDEISQLTLAFERLRKSFNILLKKMSSDQ